MKSPLATVPMPAHSQRAHTARHDSARPAATISSRPRAISPARRPGSCTPTISGCVSSQLPSPMFAKCAQRHWPCSALRRAYPDHVRERVPGLRFVFLDGDAALLHQRMAQRAGHFMQLQLLERQLNTLERPGKNEDDVLTLQADQLLTEQVAQVARAWAPDAEVRL